MHLTTIVDGVKETRELEDGSYLVGRAEACRIRLPFPDVSERHAILAINGASAVIEDLNSANGTFDFDGAAGRRDFVTCTMLQNVLVLATGSETAKGRDRTAGLRQQYSTVTLEVTPREAEMLAFAEQLKGRIVLSLRNRGDTSYEKELPKVDFEKIRSEIEELNLKRQSQRLAVR